MKQKMILSGPAVIVAGFLLRLFGQSSGMMIFRLLGLAVMAAGLYMTVRQHTGEKGTFGQLFLMGLGIFGAGFLLFTVGSFWYMGFLDYVSYLLIIGGFILMLLGYNRADHQVDVKPFLNIKAYKNKGMVRNSLLWILPGILLILWGYSEYLSVFMYLGMGLIAFGIYKVLNSQTKPDLEEITDVEAFRQEDVELSQEIRSKQLFIGTLKLAGKILKVVSVIMIIISLFTEIYWMIIVAGLLYGLCEMFIGHYEKELKTYVSDNIVRQALEAVFDIEEYKPFGTISYEKVKGSNMGISGFNVTGGSDYLKGTYKDLPVELSDMSLIHRTHSQDDDGRTVTNDEVIFQGLWLICDFGKELSADLRLWERKNRDKILGGKGIRTENEQFNRQFQVEAEIEEEAFYILTPHMMEYILEMDRKARGETHMRFERGGKVHIAIRKEEDSFEATGLSKNATQLRKKFIQEIRYITDLIDELRLVDTLYRTEKR